MRPGETPHGFLRRATRPWHDGVEDAFARFDLQTSEGLGQFLLCQAAVVLPLERSVEQAGVDAVLEDWPARRRAPSLLADLARLGLQAPPPAAVPAPATGLHVLGTLYVLEGSKLGGRVLHGRVMASPDRLVRAATAFLGHRDDRGWPRFLAVLNAAECGPDDVAALLEGAHGAFASFRAAARDTLPIADAPTRSGLYFGAHA